MQPYRFEAKNTCKFHLNNCSGNFLWKEDTQKSPWKNKVIALQKDFLLLHCFPFASAVCLLWVVQLWFFSVSSSKSTAELLCTEENCYLFLCHKEKNKKQKTKKTTTQLCSVQIVCDMTGIEKWLLVQNAVLKVTLLCRPSDEKV